jgi:putative transposase
MSTFERTDGVGGVTHVRRHHEHHRTRGGGHLYQGRYKSFPIEADDHLLTVLRYVEANALRAGLVARAEDWPWSGLHRRLHGAGPGGAAGRPAVPLAPWPVDAPADWVAVVNEPMATSAVSDLRRLHVNRGPPLGSADWGRERGRSPNRVPPSADLRRRGQFRVPRLCIRGRGERLLGALSSRRRAR